ncbi:MAG: lipopolysaccharide assembly protein LapA domain-containing protein [Microcoleaceae cyanobacterium]
MRIIPAILTSLILAGWISAIALLALQNATPVSLKFLAFESIQIPVGLVLAFSVSLGAIAGVAVPSLTLTARSQNLER